MNEKITLRAIEPEDVDFMFECEYDDSAWKWSDYTAPFSRQQLLEYALNYDANPFASRQLRLIAQTQSGMRIGIVDLFDISARDRKAYAGLTIFPDFRGNGNGKGALETLKKIAFHRLGLRKLVAVTATTNIPALKLFKNGGFEEIAVLPAWHTIDGEDLDFSLLVCTGTGCECECKESCQSES